MRKADNERPSYGGTQRLYSFTNGYGASVIKHQFSYGGDEGKWELAVLHNGKIAYDTPIISDVEGNLTDERVDELLNQIEALPKRVVPGME